MYTAVMFLVLKENLLTVFLLWISLTQKGSQKYIKFTRRNLPGSLRELMPHHLVAAVGKRFFYLLLAFNAVSLWQKGSSLQFFIMLFHLEINRRMQNGFKLCFREPEVSCSLVLELLSSHKRFYYFFSGPQ